MDLWDIKILYELDKDGRASYNQIAKNINKSKSFVQYRIENMIKKEIILDYIMVVDSSKLGFQTYDIFLQIFSNNDDEKELIDYLLSKKEINCIQKTIGKFQLYISIFAKNLNELENFFLKILNEFKNTISSYKILSIYRAYSPAHNYLFNNSFKSLNHNKEFLSSEKINLDNKDIKLLNLLENNPRASFNELASKLGSSLDNIRKRYNSLLKKEVILNIRPSIDANKLNYLHKIVLIKFKSSGLLQIENLKKHFLSLKNTIFVSYCFGEYDITGEFVFNSLKDFKEFQENIFKKYSNEISLIEYLDYFEEIRYSHYPDFIIKD